MNYFFNTEYHWFSQENKTKFFNSIAKSHNFDPYVAANWYQFTAADIREFKVFIKQYYLVVKIY
jgi:hypothetical protein